MTTDTLSRAPASEPAEQKTLNEVETHAFVGDLIDSIHASDTRLEEVRKKQCSDQICSQIMKFCKLDRWLETSKKDVNLLKYWFVRQDLTVQQGMLLLKGRLVIPAELQVEIRKPRPERQKTAMDLFELNGHMYLIVVDHYSRWIEIEHLKQTTSVAAIQHCKIWNSRNCLIRQRSTVQLVGIPEILTGLRPHSSHQ